MQLTSEIAEGRTEEACRHCRQSVAELEQSGSVNYINPKTGKGWTDREEQIIAHIMVTEKMLGSAPCSRMEAIRRMRRRRLDDLKGTTRPQVSDASKPNSRLSKYEVHRPEGLSEADRIRHSTERVPRTYKQCQGCGRRFLAKRKSQQFHSLQCGKKVRQRTYRSCVASKPKTPLVAD